ncbi:MAG: hypothetical protein GXP31_15895 [Kiritimatiellaeota bacterium]|nr:hypothetical protein [Kiritimatiellota bacterium]
MTRPTTASRGPCLPVLLVAIALSVTGGETAVNLAPNPGFEEITPKGWARQWAPGASGVFSVSTKAPHGGRRCLRFENSDSTRYVLCSAPLELSPGRCYEFEAWVRTRDVQGKDSGATICLEWSDAQGKYIGGSYPPGVKGTEDSWTRVRGISPPVPENAASCRVICYVRKNMTGVAWWDDVVVRPYFPPLLGNMATDCYRNVALPGPIRVRAALNLAGYKFGVGDVRAVLTVTGADGKVRSRVQPADITDDWIEFVVDGAKLSPGQYTLESRVLGPAGKARGNARCELRRVKELPRRRVTFDRRQRLLVDGKPFFPLGTYWSGISIKDLDLYAQSPFNCLMPYGKPTRGQLDQAEARGLKVIFSIKDYYAGSRWCPPNIRTADDERPAVEKTVRRFRDHPALLAWYLNDELPPSYMDRLTAHRRWVEELDPDHPAWIVLYQFSRVNEYLSSFDVIGTDPYPIPRLPVRTALDWTRATVRGALGLKPVWMVPQIFDHASYAKTPEDRKKSRPPTLEEMRSMAWQCIAAGANGLIFYSWFDLWRMDKLESPAVRQPFIERWKDVTAMAAEIRRFFPVLLSADDPGPAPRVEAPPTVAWRLYARNGATFVVAVNAATEPAAARFRFHRDFSAVQVQLGTAAGAVFDGRELCVSFLPLEPMVVRLLP